MSNIADIMRAAGYSEEQAALIVKIFESRTSARLLHEKDLSGPCYVYVVVNPVTRRPFYIGISKYPWARFEQHRHDRGSSAYVGINAWIRYFPPSHIFKIYRRCPDRNTALALEHRLINTTPGLLNRDRRKYASVA